MTALKGQNPSAGVTFQETMVIPIRKMSVVQCHRNTCCDSGNWPHDGLCAHPSAGAGVPVEHLTVSCTKLGGGSPAGNTTACWEAASTSAQQPRHHFQGQPRCCACWASAAQFTATPCHPVLPRQHLNLGQEASGGAPTAAGLS